MPDFERILDRMSVDLATTTEDRARAEGYILGKSSARKQVLIVISVIAILTFVVGFLYN